MVRNLRNLRGFNGKEILLGRKKTEVGLGEDEKRINKEKAVKITSGSDVILLRRWWWSWDGGGAGSCGGSGDGGDMSIRDRGEVRPSHS